MVCDKIVLGMNIGIILVEESLNYKMIYTNVTKADCIPAVLIISPL